MVADFLRNKRPEVVNGTGSRLEKRAYALIVENGYQKHDRFPVLDAAWPSVAPALPRFLAGPNDRLQTVCDALQNFLNFTGRWDERLALNQQAEAKAMAAGDHNNAGWRAVQAGAVHDLRQQADAVLACADRATTQWEKAFPKGKGAQAGARERAIAIRLRGHGHRLNKDYPAAIAAYREVVGLYRSLSPESEDVALALNSLATAEKQSGDLTAAERDYREALRVARAVSDAEGVTIYTGNLAGLALERKDWPGGRGLSPRGTAPVQKSRSPRINRRELPPYRVGLGAAGEGRGGPTLRPALGGNLHPAWLTQPRIRPRDTAGVRVSIKSLHPRHVPRTDALPHWTRLVSRTGVTTKGGSSRKDWFCRHE